MGLLSSHIYLSSFILPMFFTKKTFVPLYHFAFTTVLIWEYGTSSVIASETARQDISQLLDDIANTIQNKSSMPKQSPPATFPHAIDIKRVPFTLPSGAENIHAVRRCQFINGTLQPSATDCDDELGSGACETIFSGNKKHFRRVKESPRPFACHNKELSDLARRCAKTCAFCCETPQFNCKDSGGSLIDCATHKAKCKEPSWRRVMMSMCEHTCGLCAADACFDAADDCASLGHLCFHQAVSPLVRQQCARSCGLCTPQQGAEAAKDGGIVSQEVLDVQKTPKEVIVLVRKNSQLMTSTAEPKNGFCRDVSPSCEDNFGLCKDKIYFDFLKDKCAKTCGHCGTTSIGNDEAEDYGEDYDKDYDGDGQEFKTVRRILNRPLVPIKGNNSSATANGTEKESESTPSKANVKISADRIIIKIRGGGQKERIELRGQNGETLRISREILLEEEEDDDEEEDQFDNGRRRKQQKKKRRNLSPLLVILEKAKPKMEREAEEDEAEGEGEAFVEGTEIVGEEGETEKKQSVGGEIAHGQKRREKKIEKELSKEREAEKKIERDRNSEEGKAREAEKKEKSTAAEEENEKWEERMRENERQIDRIMVEDSDKRSNQRGQNRINREQLHDKRSTTEEERNKNKAELLQGKSIPNGNANGVKNQSANDQRKVTRDERRGTTKQQNDRKSDRQTKSNRSNETTNSNIGQIPSDRRKIVVDQRVSNESLPSSAADKPSDGKSPKNLTSDRSSLVKQNNQSTGEQQGPNSSKNGQGIRQPSPYVTTTKTGRSELSQRILQLLKNLRIAKEAVANYGTTGRRRKRSEAKEATANSTSDQKEKQKTATNGQTQTDQENGRELSDQVNSHNGRGLTDQENGQELIVDQKITVTTEPKDFRERLTEEKPPDEKMLEEQVQFVVEELFYGKIGKKDDELEEEEIVKVLMEEKQQKGREEEVEDVQEKMVDELLEQDDAAALFTVIRAVLNEIGAVLDGDEQQQTNQFVQQQKDEKVAKFMEETAQNENDNETAAEEGYERDDYAEEEEKSNEGDDQFLSDQRVPGIKEEIKENANGDVDNTVLDQTINSNALLPDDDGNPTMANDQNRENVEPFQQASAKAPKLTDFDDQQKENDEENYGRWTDQNQQRNNRFRINSDEFRVIPDDQDRKTFDGVLRDRGGRAVRVEDLPGGISGALERVRLRYGFGNGTMEEMLANLLLDTERDIANGLKAILGELRRLKETEKQRKMPKNKSERRKSGEKAFGGEREKGEKSGSDEEEQRKREKSEGERERDGTMIRPNRVISGEDRRTNSGKDNKGPIDQQDDRILRRLLKLLMENNDKKDDSSFPNKKNLMALPKKRSDRGGAVPTFVDQLLELIGEQQKKMDDRTADKEKEETKKPRPSLSTRGNRRRHIFTAPTGAASSVQSRGPATTLVLPRHVVLSSGNSPSSGYRLVPIIGPGNNMPPAAVPVTGQGNFLPSFVSNGGQSPFYPMPAQPQQREGQAVPATQPQQGQMQTPDKQQTTFGWPQQFVVPVLQQVQQQQTQPVGQQQFVSQPQQQPQPVYIPQQPIQQVQAVPAQVSPPQQPQIVVQRPAQQQLLLPNPQQQSQQNLVVVDSVPAGAATVGGGKLRAPLPLLPSPARVSSRGSYVMLRNNAIAGSGIVGPKCRDYHPYCEQIVPRGFCISEVYPLRIKREYCPQSCGLC